LLALLLIAPSSNAFWEFDWARNLAIAMYFLAILIFAFAAQALQPSLRINPIPKPGAPLITNGIYKYLRHPMYFAVMVIATALLIQKLNLVSFLFWIALGTNMSIKARYEDSLLRDIHASAKKYQENTLG
jgi:protein-S-isoprenylcysteine O-methyltransferase Ste14